MKNRLPAKSLIMLDDANFYYGFKKYLKNMDYAKFYKWLNANFGSIEICFLGYCTRN